MNKYTHLSQCKDFDLLLNHYPEEQLEDFETAIREYEESGCSEENFEEQAYYGYSDIINWYEGTITTEDLFEFLESSDTTMEELIRDKNRTFTEQQIWDAIYQASGECMDDCEFLGMLTLAEAIMGIPYKKIEAILGEENLEDDDE